jgi:hypothetical protein
VEFGDRRGRIDRRNLLMRAGADKLATVSLDSESQRRFRQSFVTRMCRGLTPAKAISKAEVGQFKHWSPRLSNHSIASTASIDAIASE